LAPVNSAAGYFDACRSQIHRVIAAADEFAQQRISRDEFGVDRFKFVEKDDQPRRFRVFGRVGRDL